jgi:hypothetical protein
VKPPAFRRRPSAGNSQIEYRRALQESVMKPAVFAFVMTSLVAPLAWAQPDTKPAAPPTAAAADIPDQCKGVATAPPSAEIAMPGLVAKVSLAYCGARLRFSALKIAPDDASIAALNEAAKPSFALLDEVIQANDPVASDMARRLRASLLIAMAVRIRDAVPPITPTTVGPQLAELLKMHDDLEPKIKPWLDTAKM